HSLVGLGAVALLPGTPAWGLGFGSPARQSTSLTDVRRLVSCDAWDRTRAGDKSYLRSVVMRVMLVAVIGCVLLGDGEQSVEVKKEMALLQGEWSMVSGEIDGKAMPEDFLKGARRTAKGDETTIVIAGQLFMKATFTIDPAKKPKTIDYTMTDGFSKGKKQLGIYEITGEGE